MRQEIGQIWLEKNEKYGQDYFWFANCGCWIIESENHYGDGAFIPLDAVENEEHATCVKSTKDGS